MKLLMLLAGFGGLALVATPAIAFAAKPALFAGSVGETFRIVGENNQTPKFRVLDDGPGERALAVAIAAALNTKRQKNEKAIPVSDHLDVAVESIQLKPSTEKTGELDVRLRLSGRDWDLEQTVNREKLLSGEWIEIASPKQTKSLAIYSVDSTAKLRFRWVTARNELEISEGSAKLDYQSDWAGSGDESIRFSGRGLRGPK